MAQTDGTPLPEPTEAGGDPGATTDRLKAAIAARGIVVDYVQELDGALGTSSGGCIQVLAGLQPASEFMVLAHEFAHLCTPSGYVRLHQASHVVSVTDPAYITVDDTADLPTFKEVRACFMTNTEPPGTGLRIAMTD